MFEKIWDVRWRKTRTYVSPILGCTSEGASNVRLRMAGTYVLGCLQRTSEKNSATYVREASGNICRWAARGKQETACALPVAVAPYFYAGMRYEPE